MTIAEAIRALRGYGSDDVLIRGVSGVTYRGAAAIAEEGGKPLDLVAIVLGDDYVATIAPAHIEAIEHIGGREKP